MTQVAAEQKLVEFLKGKNFKLGRARWRKGTNRDWHFAVTVDGKPETWVVPERGEPYKKLDRTK